MLVSGKVQGIGYRWFVQDQAILINATGWIKNLSDGSVEIEVQADAPALEKFEHALKNDHSMARVSTIKTDAIPVEKNEKEFTIKF